MDICLSETTWWKERTLSLKPSFDILALAMVHAYRLSSHTHKPNVKKCINFSGASPNFSKSSTGPKSVYQSDTTLMFIAVVFKEISTWVFIIAEGTEAEATCLSGNEKRKYAALI